MRNICLYIVLICLVACKEDEPPQTAIISENSLATIGITDGQFIDSEGNTFFPWGYNYTNAEGIGLIEDDWLSSDTWQLIDTDFDEMKSYAANIVRIHLQYHKFMIDETTANEANLDRLLELVLMAEEKGLYLDITGLASYRKSDSPDWYDALNDEERWNTHKVFWQNIAQKVGSNNAVFAYNLMNEPVVAVGCDVVNACDWLPGDAFGGFNFVQNISRDPSKTFSPTMQEWATEMTTAIRSVDTNTMITIGFLPLGDIAQFENDLDYVSVHIYPESGILEEAVSYIEENQTSPLIIEETSNLYCNITELEEFLDAIDGKYHGLLGHYQGKNLEELEDSSITDALKRNFIEMMMNRNPNE